MASIRPPASSESRSNSEADTHNLKRWTAEPDKLWHVEAGTGPFVGLAVHAGHNLRPGLRNVLAIDDITRRREEDPFTDQLAALCGTYIITYNSRFEVDLNRPADEAICVQPEDCWNLHVWKQEDGLTQTMYRRSLAEHAAFFKMFEAQLQKVEERERRFLVLDCHSYNHRRDGPHEAPANPRLNPEINIGTGSMDRDLWAPLVEQFMSSLSKADYLGRRLDVRENVKFKGRHIAHFVHTKFPKTGCCLAIEVKKFFMDEWTGELDKQAFQGLLNVFRSALDVVEKEFWRR